MATWTHSDPQLSLSAARGLEILESAGWVPTKEDESAWLGLTALRGLIIGYLIGSVTQTTTADGRIGYEVSFDIDQPPSARRTAALQLLAPLRAYLVAVEESTNRVTSANETGVIPIALIAGAAIRIAIITGATVAFSHAVDKVSELLDGMARRKTDVAIIQQKDAVALKAAAQHIEAEQKAGKELPLDEATKRLLEDASEAARVVLKKHERQEEEKKEEKNQSWLPGWVPWVGGAVAATALIATIKAAFGRK